MVEPLLPVLLTTTQMPQSYGKDEELADCDHSTCQ